MEKARRKCKDLSSRPVVEIEHHSYRPTKEELEADISIDTTPEELAKAVLRDVTLVRKPRRK